MRAGRESDETAHVVGKHTPVLVSPLMLWYVAGIWWNKSHWR